MREKYEAELADLKNYLIEMGQFSSQMLVQSVEALKQQDSDLADAVWQRRKELSVYDREIEDRTLKLIALYQPLAKDLRMVGSILKMSTDLYRIGRYGKDIAMVAKELAGQTYFKKLITIPTMAEKVEGMLSDALHAFETENTEGLKNFGQRDDEIDEMRYSIFRECVSYMMEDHKIISQASQFLLIARYLERCGDHCCNIVAKIFYITTGEHVEIK